MADQKLRWSGYEFEYKEKTADWYWAVGISTISIAIVSFIYDNPLFGLFIAIAGAILLFTAKKEPRLIDYTLTERGFLMNNTLYPHIHFTSFWVSENKFASPKLLLRTNKIVHPILIIPIETDYVDAETIRDFLLDYIPENKIEEPLSLKFMEFLGF